MVKIVAVKRKRVRGKALHVSLTDAELAEFQAIRDEHGLLERELVMQAVRAYKTLVQRVDVLEAEIRLLVAKGGMQGLARHAAEVIR